MLKVDLCL
jgi:hypothetical protein